ncbi:MAG: response regulator [Myxococcota bacterium]
MLNGDVMIVSVDASMRSQIVDVCASAHTIDFATLDDARDALRGGDFDAAVFFDAGLVVEDGAMADFASYRVPVVALVADDERASAWLQAGAHDCVRTLDALPDSLIRVMHIASLEKERDELREELRQALRLEAIGRLAGGVAHDFNNLLTTVSCFASFIDEAAGDDATKEDVREILRATERGTDLTERLLSLSHQRSHRPAALSMEGVLQDLQRLIAKTAGVEIRVQLDLHTNLAPIFFDRSDLEQAILHTVVQARDAMRHGGQIVFRSSQRDDRVELELEDDGPGLDDSELARVFGTETQEASTPTSLALRTVRRLLESGDATFQIETKLGVGSRYCFSFPRYQVDVAPVSQAPEPIVRIDGRGRTAILLELDEGVARSTTRLLERHDFVVERVPSFRDLQRGLREQRWELPGVALVDEAALGGGTLERLRLAAPGVDRILLVGETRPSDDSTDVMLVKPFGELELMRAMRKARARLIKLDEERSPRILIVDDDELTARGIERVLDGLCESERIFGERSELLARLENDDYDLVICDVLMPGINGMQLFEWIRARSPALAHRFVFLTAAAEFDIIREFAASIPNPVFPKPMSRSGFESLLTERGLLQGSPS